MPIRPLTKTDVLRLVDIDAERFPEIDQDFDVQTGHMWWTIREADFEDVFSPAHPSSFHGLVYYSAGEFGERIGGAVLLETRKRTIDVISTIRTAKSERDILRMLLKEAKIFAKKHGKTLRFIVPDGDDTLLQFLRSQKWEARLLTDHYEANGVPHDGWEMKEPALAYA